MKTSLIPRALIACAVTTTAMLAGCHATVDARSTTPDDTVYRWEHALPNLPVEVRGRWPNATDEQVTHAIPRSLSLPYASDQPAARLVVEVGPDGSPRTDAYCATPNPAQGRADPAPAAHLTLTLTLCDGMRLVASSRTPLDADEGTVEHLPRQLDRLKNLILIGIDESPAQRVHIQG
jgi:hypothetical protein